MQLSLLLVFIPYVVSHISFLFPAPRYPPLDFLDASRTILPCGMSRGKNPYFTTFSVGKSYNLTWTSNHHLHSGGVKLTLFDSSEQYVEQIQPAEYNKWLTASKEVPLNVTVTFTRPCHHCILQIQRQALEYGPSYIFHSCADVDIEDNLEDSDETRCSGNGRFTGNKCMCRKRFTGDACQYRVDCENDLDCFNGKCITESRPSLVQKTCYCNYGFYGKNCETQFKNEDPNDMCFNYENLVDTTSPMFKKYGIFNPDCYEQTSLNGEDFVYSRLIENEVEIIMDFNTTGWVSIGWRPLKLDPSCRLFPDIGLPRSRTFRQADSKTNGFLKSALQASLHAMDCTDIIVASVVDGRSRVQDMYTRDRSTPLLDSFLEGENSLTAAFGIERDGRTVVMFRRNIREIEPSDHPLGPGKIHGIYAKSSEASDELRYHGRFRGTTTFDFVKAEAMPVSGPLLFIRKDSQVPSTPVPEQESKPAETLDFTADFQIVETPSPELETLSPSPEPTPTVGVLSSTSAPTNELQSSKAIGFSLISTLVTIIISFIIIL